MRLSYLKVMVMKLFMYWPMLTLAFLTAIAHRLARTPMFRPGFACVADFIHARRTVGHDV